MNFKRREFIRLSGITVAGSMIIPSLLHSCKGVPVSDGAASYLDHFEVSPEQLQKVILTAMEKGADYADLFFEHTISNSTGLQDQKVNSAYSNVIFGVGIRVLKGDQTGFAYSENTTLEAMVKAARTASNIADSTSGYEQVNISEFEPASYYKINSPWEDIPIKDKIPFITSLDEKIFAGDKRVTKVNISLSDSTTYIMFFTQRASSHGTTGHLHIFMQDVPWKKTARLRMPLYISRIGKDLNF